MDNGKKVKVKESIKKNKKVKKARMVKFPAIRTEAQLKLLENCPPLAELKKIRIEKYNDKQMICMDQYKRDRKKTKRAVTKANRKAEIKNDKMNNLVLYNEENGIVIFSKIRNAAELEALKDCKLFTEIRKIPRIHRTITEHLCFDEYERKEKERVKSLKYRRKVRHFNKVRNETELEIIKRCPPIEELELKTNAELTHEDYLCIDEYKRRKIIEKNEEERILAEKKRKNHEDNVRKAKIKFKIFKDRYEDEIKNNKIANSIIMQNKEIENRGKKNDKLFKPGKAEYWTNFSRQMKILKEIQVEQLIKNKKNKEIENEKLIKERKPIRWVELLKNKMKKSKKIQIEEINKEIINEPMQIKVEGDNLNKKEIREYNSRIIMSKKTYNRFNNSGIKKICHGAGIERIGGDCYAKSRIMIADIMYRIVGDAMRYADSGRRKTVNSSDATMSLRHNNN